MANEQWRDVRDHYPDDFRRACDLDEAIRRESLESYGEPIWLHHSRVPLADADLDAKDRRSEARQCGLGLCMI